LDEKLVNGVITVKNVKVEGKNWNLFIYHIKRERGGQIQQILTIQEHIYDQKLIPI
jgi:hypothetical protein